MKKEVYAPGDVLCDMHDGLSGLPDNLVKVSGAVCRLCVSGGGEFIKHALSDFLGSTYTYTNKYLVVMPSDYAPDSQGGIVAAYSYDDREFVLLRLVYRT